MSLSEPLSAGAQLPADGRPAAGLRGPSVAAPRDFGIIELTPPHRPAPKLADESGDLATSSSFPSAPPSPTPSAASEAAFDATTPPAAQMRRKLTPEDRQHLIEVRQLLCIGTPQPDGNPILPFRFHVNGHVLRHADNPGLEGFLFDERRFVLQFGEEKSIALLPDYLRYCLDAIRPLAWTKPLQLALTDLSESSAPPAVRYDQFIATLRSYVEDQQNFVRDTDPARWARSLRAYHCFTSASPLRARRSAYVEGDMPPDGYDGFDEARPWFQDLTSTDFSLLAEYGFNALRVMGTYPRGEANRKGTGSGSPFSIRRYQVDPALGSDEDVMRAVALGERYGIRTIFEFVPNHTAVDADLLLENPRLYVHTTSRPADETGYFFFQHPSLGDFWIRHGAYRDAGGRHYFTDTLQLDLSNPETRATIAAWATSLIDRYGIHGLRVDMAHHILASNFQSCWEHELAQELPKQEFLSELVAAIKERRPDVAVIAEAFGGTRAEFEHLSGSGVDLVYNIDDIPIRGGQHHLGWFIALSKRDPALIRSAMRRAEFLEWQSGGSGGVTFVGQHDRPAPWREFGDWVSGALFLTALKPGALCMYAGTEAQFEAPCAEDGKMISFNTAQSIRWEGIYSDFGEYLHRCLLEYKRIRELLGEDLAFQVLEPSGNQDFAPIHQRWVGFLVQPRRTMENAPKALVLANLADEPIIASVPNPEPGLPPIEVPLGKCGPNGQVVAVIEYDAASGQRLISLRSPGQK